jgi:hypothetical protein
MDNAVQAVPPVDDFEIIEEPAREPFVVDDDSKGRLGNEKTSVNPTQASR